jgi:hypothetical protein
VKKAVKAPPFFWSVKTTVTLVCCSHTSFTKNELFLIKPVPKEEEEEEANCL